MHNFIKTLQEIKTTPSSQWVFWVGAGISNPAPTNLPLGRELTEFTLENICGHDVKNAIIDIWNKTGEIFQQKGIQGDFSVIPRLESILDVVNNFETKTIGIDYSFMSGFKAFLDAPYNNLHASLAKLLSSGATIITSNFDLCIENAYGDLKKTTDELSAKNYGNLVIYKSTKIPTSGEIWHYHGTVDKVQNMGATLSIIKEGLTDEVRMKLVELFRRSRVLVFLGYSFSDAFDVNPFFESQPDRVFNNALAIFFQHNSDYLVPPSEKTQRRIRRLLQCFGSYRFDWGETSEFLAELSGVSVKRKGNFDWKKSFLAQVKFRSKDEVKPFLICQISNLLGIQTNKLSRDVYRDALSFENSYPNDEFHDTMAVVLRRQGKYKEEKAHHLKKHRVSHTKGDEPDFLGYYYGLGMYEEAKKYSTSIEELSAGIANPNTVLSWKYYTSMSVYCRPLIMSYLKRINWGRVRTKDKQVIQEYLSVLDKLGWRPLQSVVFINQLATALRFRMIFNALLYGQDDALAQERILYLYGEGSSIEGYVSAYRDIAIKYHFLFRLHRRDFHKKVLDYGTCSLEIARLVGDSPGIKSAQILLFLHEFASALGWIKIFVH